MDIENDISRLHFENFLWILFIILACLNILGDYDDEKFLNTNFFSYKEESNYIFIFTIFITLVIYFYFFIRNYELYRLASVNEQNQYFIKLFGSSLLIVGTLCLLYFQINEKNFIGSPVI